MSPSSSLRRRLLPLAALLAPLLFGMSAQAQDAASFPTAPVKIIVGSPAGASADMLARTLARKLSETTGQNFLVENLVGGAGNLAPEHVANSAPDGYTILLSGDALSINGTLFSDLKYDPATAFAGVTKAVVSPQILVGRVDLGVENLQDYVDLVRAQDGNLAFGRLGIGGIAHIANEILSLETGTKVNYIPYAGGAPAAADLLGGHVDAIIITLAAVTEHVRAGKLLPIAVTTSYRSTALPDVPTFAESGFPDFAIESWQGFVVPAATPRDIVARLNTLFVDALNDPEIKAFLEGQGFVVAASTAEGLDETIRSDIPTYADIIERAGITVE